MMKKKMAALMLAAVLALSLLSGCGGNSGDAQGNSGSGTSGTERTDGTESGGEDIRLGVIFKTLSNPFYITMQEGVEAAAGKYGYQITVQAPELESDCERQMQIMENMITQQVDAIILTPNGSTELVPAIKKANDANIPVIIIDSRVYPDALEAADAHTECFIGSDNYFGGSLAAEKMAEALNGSGKVAVLEGVAGQEVSVQRVGGFVDKAKELGLDVVASQPADWDQGQGYTVAQNILQANPDLSGLFGASDLMALGGIKAIEDAGLADKVTVIGFDANDDAKTAISEGRMYGSIAQSPDEMGSKAVEVFKTLHEGGTVEEEIAVDVYMVDASNCK